MISFLSLPLQALQVRKADELAGLLVPEPVGDRLQAREQVQWFHFREHWI